MTDRDLEIQREERAVYVVIAAALLPVVVAALVAALRAALHEGAAAFDGGTTLSALILALAVIGLGAGLRTRPARLPQVRVHRRRSR